MINGWIEVTEQKLNAHSTGWQNRWVNVPTGEQECPDCKFRTSVNDLFGSHNCPEMRDCHGNIMAVDDIAYAYSSSKIRKVKIVKYKKETDNIGVEELDNPGDLREDGQPRRYTVTDHGKILRIDE